VTGLNARDVWAWNFGGAKIPAPSFGLCIFFLCLALPAAAQSGGKGEFFVGASAETACYSVDSAAAGGGLTFGYGFDIGALGLKAVYLADTTGLATLETGLFLRFYLPLSFIGAENRFRSGPFLQLGFGPAFFARDDFAAAVSAGLTAGWRFLIGKHWYAEPALRGGYPYVVGAGVSGGYRF
jgi:hypothetical protein